MLTFDLQECRQCMKELNEPPEGYDSVKGAKATEEDDSFFKVTIA